MPALATVGDYLEESRRLLQDEIPPYRYPDADLVDALNLALLEARRLRADLFLSNRFEIPYFGTVEPNVEVPFEPMYRPALVNYIVGRAQLRDDEATTDQRAASLMTRFVQQMLVITS